MRRTLLIVAALAVLGVAGGAQAGFVLVLEDGVKIEANSIRRYGDTYEVRSWSGDTMSVRASEIRQILATEDPPGESGGGDEPSPANRVRSSRDPSGDRSPREGPPAEPHSPPRAEAPPRVEVDPHMRPRTSPNGGDGGMVLSGPNIALPTREEELEALGPPSQWSKPSIDPSWHPEDAFSN